MCLLENWGFLPLPIHQIKNPIALARNISIIKDPEEYIMYKSKRTNRALQQDTEDTWLNLPCKDEFFFILLVAVLAAKEYSLN